MNESLPLNFMLLKIDGLTLNCREVIVKLSQETELFFKKSVYRVLMHAVK